MTKEELTKILENHKKWLNSDKHGIRANLYGADLDGADLYGANLYGANLYGADLRDANLYGANLRAADLRAADLRGANLRGANLYGANLRAADLRAADLRGANLRGANLRAADLRGADLRDANLYGADLDGADLYGADLPIVRCIPEEGNFLGYKKCIDENSTEFLLTLEIISNKRISPIVGRKCRAEKVRTVKIETMEGIQVKNKTLKLFGKTQKCPKTVYQLGKITKSDQFNEDITLECTNGIHFFATKQEAKEY